MHRSGARRQQSTVLTGGGSQDSARAQRLAKFETFINDRLRPDLMAILARRDAVFAEIADYVQLRSQVLALNPGVETKSKNDNVEEDEKDGAPPLVKSSKDVKSLLNVGCEVFMQARIEDAARIFVRVGCNTHVEMTPEEALAFVDRKEKMLQGRADKLTENASSIKAHIKVVLQAMQEILNIDAEAQPISRPYSSF